MNINDLNVSNAIIRAVSDMGFEAFTQIQDEAIPLCIDGFDMIGQSQTGTGKTAAFAIPILEKIDPENRKPQALILCPTRELAVQVADEFKRIAKYMHGVRAVAIYGGEPIHRQISALSRGAQVVIGTPGRTIDHITKRKTLKTSEITTIVLDEADEMLKMGFREDIELVLSTLPEERQTILFSATMPKEILDITHKYQKDPKLVKVTQNVVTAETVKQDYCEMRPGHKFEALSRLLEVIKPNRCIIFCNTKNQVNVVAEELLKKGFNSEMIHGDLKQEMRLAVLKKFNNSIVNIIVATDVAARGLDIKEVDLVINYDVPDKEDYYVHRIGRSGRAGMEGRAISLVSGYEKRRLMAIMHYTKQNIEKIKIPTVSQVQSSKIQDFIDGIAETIQNENLDDYKAIFDQIDTIYPVEDICAALIKNNLELSDSAHPDNDINYMQTGGRREGARKERTSKRSDRKGERPKEKDMTRIFFNVGRMDKVSPKHLVGAIANEAGISGKLVGAIDVLERFSFVDVHKDVAKKVVMKLAGKRINEKQVSPEVADKKKRKK